MASRKYLQKFERKLKNAVTKSQIILRDTAYVFINFPERKGKEQTYMLYCEHGMMFRLEKYKGIDNNYNSLWDISLLTDIYSIKDIIDFFKKRYSFEEMKEVDIEDCFTFEA